MSNGNAGRKVVVEPTAEDAVRFAAKMLTSIVCESASRRGVCRLALAGGTTPRQLYQHLARTATQQSIPWDRAEVFFGDERDVPHDNVESNYRMAQRALLDHVPIPPANVHPMPADADDLAAAAREYEQIVRKHVPAGPDGIPRFDLIHLGMGGEGHVASLFPFTEVLDEREQLVTAAFVPVLGRHRMTFTYPLINAGRNVMLFVTGEDKAPAIAKLLSGRDVDPHRMPVVGVRPADGNLFVILDTAAASQTGLRPE